MPYVLAVMIGAASLWSVNVTYHFPAAYRRSVSAVPTSWPTGRRGLRERRSFASVAEEHLDDVYRYLLYLTGRPEMAEEAWLVPRLRRVLLRCWA